MSYLDDELKSLGVSLDDLEELQAIGTIVGLIYGPNGAGKTWQFNNLPPKEGLFVNAERGHRSVINSKAGSKIEIVSLGQLARVLVGLKKDLENHTCPFNYLFVDSATGMYKTDIAAQAKTSAADPENKQSDPDVPSLRDYLKVSKRVDRVINFAKDLPLTVIFTAMEQHMMDDNKIERIGPAMSGAVRDSFVMYSDFVLYMQTLSDGRRQMLTAQQGKYIAKVRMPFGKTIPPKILNPNIYEVIRAIRGEDVKFEQP
jgi:hypothetical protein